MAAWDTGLFDCCSNIKVLALSCICCPCQVSYHKAAVEEHPCGLSDFIPVCITIPCCLFALTRGKIREKYGLEGSGCGDCAASVACFPCAVSQQTRQLDMKGAKPAGVCMEE